MRADGPGHTGLGEQRVTRQKRKASIWGLLSWGQLRTRTVPLVKPLCYTCLSFPSNKSPYMEGEIGHVLRTLSNLGLKRHFLNLKIKQSTSHFIWGCDSVVS